MSPSTICPPTRANRRQLGWLLSLLLVLALVWPLPVVRADTHGQLQSNEVSYTFAEAIYFDLEAQATTPPTDVILFYGIDGEPVWRRIYPDGDLGTKIDIAYTEELLPGQFAPGETLRYYWRIEFADGTRLETPVERFVYEDDRFEWHMLSGTTIDLHYYGNAKNQAADLLVVAQEAQERLSTEVGVATDTRLQVYLYNSARDMSAALAQRSTIFDSQVTTLGVAVSDDTLLLLGADENAPATLAHELSHLIVGLATDNPYAGLPRWLDEGLAMYAEGQLPRNNRLALEQAIKEDSLLTIRSMSSYSGQAEQVDMYYGAVYSVVDYMLQTYGRDKMRALLRVFAQGARQEDALQQVYGLTLDELDAGWRQSLGLEPRSAPTSAPLFLLLQKAAA